MWGKLIWAAVALVLGLLILVAWWTTQIPDQQVEAITTSSCVPLYYSGLECCKN